MNFQHFFAVGLALFAPFVGGCQAQHSVTKQNNYLMDKTDSRAVKVLWADVYEQEGQTAIKGAFRRKLYSSASLRTHIDVQLVSPDGKILYETRTKDMGVPRRSVGRGADFKRFTIILPQQPPRNSLVRLICHAGDHPQK